MQCIVGKPWVCSVKKTFIKPTEGKFDYICCSAWQILKRRILEIIILKKATYI